jgi:hypothetical protein
MARPRLTADVKAWIDQLALMLDERVAWRLQALLAGLLFATGRRTVSSWLRAGQLSKDYQDYYYFLAIVGRKTQSLASSLLGLLLRTLEPSGRVLLGIDDTPSKRYGPKVEGAGIHHNPTPGPAGAKYIYGHNWVTLAWLARHPLWGAIGLPLLARMYVRQKDVAGQRLSALRGVTFQTKLVMAAELVQWAAARLHGLGLKLWVAADGAYAKKVFLKAAAAARVVVVSRLRKDAALFDLPKPVPPGRRGRGRPRLYGAKKISLAKRASHAKGWQEETFVLYGVEQVKRYKTFLATYRPAGGLIRVVLVKEEDRTWRAYFCTAPEASVTQILEAVADRSALEQVYHDVKEVHGVGQAQTRNYWVNVGVFHLKIWLHTLIELWAWRKPAAELVDRHESPWDDAKRRPSHADRRNSLRRTCLEQEFQAAATAEPVTRKIERLWRRVVRLVA